MTIREIDGTAFRRPPSGCGRREARALGVDPGSRRFADDVDTGRRGPRRHRSASSDSTRRPAAGGLLVDRAPRRRAGRRRRAAGRRPPRAAPADSLDRGDRAAAAGLADVRRRHRARCGTASTRASPRWCGCSRDGPPRRRSIAACASCCWCSFSAWSVPAWRLTVDERRASGCRRAGCPARRSPRVLPVALLLMAVVVVQQLRRGRPRRLARSRVARLVAGAAGCRDRVGAGPAPRGRAAARRARHRLSRDRRARRCRSPSRWR